jgi:hypothetical protein
MYQSQSTGKIGGTAPQASLNGLSHTASASPQMQKAIGAYQKTMGLNQASNLKSVVSSAISNLTQNAKQTNGSQTVSNQLQNQNQILSLNQNQNQTNLTSMTHSVSQKPSISVPNVPTGQQASVPSTIPSKLTSATQSTTTSSSQSTTTIVNSPMTNQKSVDSSIVQNQALPNDKTLMPTSLLSVFTGAIPLDEQPSLFGNASTVAGNQLNPSPTSTNQPKNNDFFGHKQEWQKSVLNDIKVNQQVMTRLSTDAERVKQERLVLPFVSPFGSVTPQKSNDFLNPSMLNAIRNVSNL